VICASVKDASEVADARRRIAALTEAVGFDEVEVGRVCIAVTELATNLVKHGSGGALLAAIDDYSAVPALQMLALDRGEGMASVQQCMQDGFTSVGSSGTGLGAIQRQSHELDIYSSLSAGTAIYARLEKGRVPTRAAEHPRSFGAVTVSKAGEVANGDAWAAAGTAGNRTYLVVDGLGHGELAAEASRAAVEEFRRCAGRSLTEILNAIHQALRHTRGAAVAVARTDEERDQLTFAGVGNIGGTIISEGESRKTVSRNGTVGLTIPRIQEYVYPFSRHSTFFMYSDGMLTNWSCDPYPGLLARHPMLIAGVLYRDFRRERDDVTMLVAVREH
jgi:anti-sigma regulatory factor (Ser/Thr protein kinase)